MAMRDFEPGFTIIEVLIVLAITVILFFSAVRLLSGRQNNAEFMQATADIKSQIQLEADNVINGSYVNNNNFSCSYSGGNNVTINTGVNNLEGQNLGCIFLGKLFAFGVPISSGNQPYYTYTVIGSQCALGSFIDSYTGQCNGQQSTSISNASPTINSYISNEHSLTDNLTIQSMYYNNNTSNLTGLMAFLQSLASYNDTGGATNLAPGSQQVQLWALSGTSVTANTSLGENGVIGLINRASDNATTTPPLWIQVNSVEICFTSGTTPQSYLLTIGGQGSQVSLSSQIFSGASC